MRKRLSLLALPALLALGYLAQPKPASAAYVQWLKISAGVGAWMQGAMTASATQLTMGRYTPTDPDTTQWWQHAGSFANTTGPRRNQVMRFGWNCGPGGGRATTGALNGALCEEWEQYYETGGGNKVVERHMGYVAPDETLTRYLSFAGNLESPYNTALYIYSSSIVLGSGNDANDPPQVVIGSGSTLIEAPSGYNKIIADDDALGYVSIQAGSVLEGATQAQINFASNGQIVAQAVDAFRVSVAGNLQLEISTTLSRIRSPDTLLEFQVNDGGAYVLRSGATIMRWDANSTIAWKPIMPAADSSSTYTLGGSSGRFGYVAVQVVGAGSLPTCDGYNQGAITTVYNGASASSTVVACLQAADNSYAWRTIFTAP
jgi:hypothetical protein